MFDMPLILDLLDIKAKLLFFLVIFQIHSVEL
jgi:hypothetical protein